MIKTYTDGGCSGNPGPGAWAYVIEAGGKRSPDSGAERDTTNNRMELTAVIKALEYIEAEEVLREQEVEVFTDSVYVKKGITEWIEKWLLNGWKSSSKKPVKNQDLWKKLHFVSGKLHVKWYWVMGHSGDELNELCDRMVKEELRKS